MGGKQSKKEGTNNARQTPIPSVPQQNLLQFGEKSEFWFRVDRINRRSIDSAKTFYEWLQGKLGGFASLVLGVTFLNESEVQVQAALVHCKDYETAKTVCNDLSSKALLLAGRPIATSCMPDPSENESEGRKKPASKVVDLQNLHGSFKNLAGANSTNQFKSKVFGSRKRQQCHQQENDQGPVETIQELEKNKTPFNSKGDLHSVDHAIVSKERSISKNINKGQKSVSSNRNVALQTTTPVARSPTVIGAVVPEIYSKKRLYDDEATAGSSSMRNVTTDTHIDPLDSNKSLFNPPYTIKREDKCQIQKSKTNYKEAKTNMPENGSSKSSSRIDVTDNLLKKSATITGVESCRKSTIGDVMPLNGDSYFQSGLDKTSSQTQLQQQQNSLKDNVVSSKKNNLESESGTERVENVADRVASHLNSHRQRPVDDRANISMKDESSLSTKVAAALVPTEINQATTSPSNHLDTFAKENDTLNQNTKLIPQTVRLNDSSIRSTLEKSKSSFSFVDINGTPQLTDDTSMECETYLGITSDSPEKDSRATISDRVQNMILEGDPSKACDAVCPNVQMEKQPQHHQQDIPNNAAFVNRSLHLPSFPQDPSLAACKQASEYEIKAEMFEKSSVMKGLVQENEIKALDQLKNEVDIANRTAVLDQDDITTQNALEISLDDVAVESVSDSTTVCSKMSDVTDGSRKLKSGKYPFIVFIANLPNSITYKEIVSLFEGKHPGFIKVLKLKQNGTAIAVFSSAEQASSCAKQVKGSNVRGRRIMARANISDGCDSSLKKRFLEDEQAQGVNEKVSDWLDNKRLAAHHDFNKKNAQDEFPVMLADNQSVCTVKSEDAQVSGNNIGVDTKGVQGEEYVVVVGNLPNFFTPQQLYETFIEKCPGIKETVITKPGYGEIVFYSKKEMEGCIRRKHISGSKTLSVCPKDMKSEGNDNPSDGCCQKQNRRENLEKKKPSRKEKLRERPEEEQKKRQQPSLQQQQIQQKQQQLQQQEQQQKQQQQQQKKQQQPQEQQQIQQKQHQQKQQQQPQKQQRQKQQQQPQKQQQKQQQQQMQQLQQKQQHQQQRKQHQEQQKQQGPAQQQQEQLQKQHQKQQQRQQQQQQPFQPQQNQQPLQHQQNKATNKSTNHTVKLSGFPPGTNEQDIRKLIENKCKGVEVLKIVLSKRVYIVKLNSQNDCQRVYGARRQLSYNGAKIKVSWKRQSEEINKDKLYVVVKNLHPNFEQKDIKNVFKNCRGVVHLTKKPNDTFARVYFESLDFAEEAVNKVNGFVVGRRKLEVSPAVGILVEIKRRRLNLERNEYLAQLLKKKETSLTENDKKMQEHSEEHLEKSIPVFGGKKKKVPLEEFERRKAIRETYEQKKQELRSQRKEFENKYQQLLESFNRKFEDHQSVDDNSGLKEILQTHKKITQREFRKFKASLPIYAKRSEIVEIVSRNQVVVLIGETGSGKSTQLAQYLAEESFSERGKIVVTQPRKIAAISLAKRVSEEYDCKLGHEVGYHVGLDKKINNDKTIIKFVTDRILLNEVLKGAENMQQYSCIIIDEAHERSIHTDLLVAMIKQQLASLPHLRLIVTSATLNTDIFRRYFDNCPLVKVQGRTFPVERVYLKERPADYVDSVFDKVVEVCESGEEGDILVFLTQQNEIEKTSEKLQKKLGAGRNIILPLHGKLQSDEQQQVFHPTPKGKRKIVLATNSAETSITVDGIRIVVDSGMVKEPSFDPKRNMTTLEVKLVSQSSAKQRSGRAGRTAPGKCYCLYTEDDFNKMERSTKPEILKMHLGMAVLQLLSLGVTDVEQFDFVESPSRDALTKALESLKLLGALNPDGTLNHLGEEMLELPTEPQLSKALLEGLRRGCGGDMIIAAALMSSGHDVFYRGDTAEKRNECAIQKQEFCQSSGDLFSAIDVFKTWSLMSKKDQAKWCKENALNAKLLRSARETGNEIREALMKLRPGLNLEVTSDNIQESISKSLLAGYFENVAWSFGHDKLGYNVLTSNERARIHPSSVLSSLGDQPKWVLFQEIRHTSDQVFLLNLTPIDHEWLAEVAMHVLEYVDEDTINRSRVVRERIQSVGPGLAKAVIGYQGSTIKQIETSVSEYGNQFPAMNRHSVFCAVECKVEKGIVDVYTTIDCLGKACQLVQDVIETKRQELQGYTEVIISNVGNLKTLVSSDLRTISIIQPGTFCKFDVYVHKQDEIEKVELSDIRDVLTDDWEVIHSAIEVPKGGRNSKWGTITYSNAIEAEAAKHYLQSDPDLPLNVEEIELRSSRYERVTSQSQNTQFSGVRVLFTWFPFPANEIAYIKCNNRNNAEKIVNQLNDQDSCQEEFLLVGGPLSKSRKAFLKKISRDIAVHVEETDDEFTVRRQLEDCCTTSQLESVAKITVPSSKEDVNREEEKTKLARRMKRFGNIQVINLWIENCKKVRARLVFDDLKSAKKVIRKLNRKMGVLGVRRMYVEWDREREIMCDARVYEKIKKTVDKMKKNDVKIDVEKCHKRMKITVTGDNAEDVQKIGASLADLVTPEILMIEDAAVARVLSGGYGRAKVKQIEKNNSAIIRTSNFGRRIQITAGSSDAKREARTQIERLIKELQKTKCLEVEFRSSDRPVGAIREILKHFGKDLSRLVEGEDCQASMEIRRRKLVLNGAADAVTRVQTKVEEFLETLPNACRETKVSNECPVCLGDIEDPYLLHLCGHAYCSACIGQYLTNVFDSVKSRNMFPQKCMYNKCEWSVIKEDYELFLSTDQIEKLYRVSLECFLIGNENFKPCPTADCSWVYEASSKPSVFTCLECGVRLCKSCDDTAHPLYDTCEAFKATKDPSQSERLYAEWVSSANTKKCPKCLVMIEKNKGCSHVECSQCKAHICWKCGKYFPTSSSCYEHIDFCKK